MANDLTTVSTHGYFGTAYDRIVAIALQGQYNLLHYTSRKIIVRETAPLTTEYVASDNIDIYGDNQLQLIVSFIKGDSEGCKLKIEFSEDETDWYQESWYNIDVETGDVIHDLAVRRIDTSSNALISTPVWARFFRVQALAIASGVGTSLSIMASAANIYTGEQGGAPEYTPRIIIVREAAPLTTSYVPSDILNINGANQLQLMASFNKGLSDGCRLVIEFSEDGLAWYQETWYNIENETGEVVHSLAFRRISESSNTLISTPVWARFCRIQALAITSATDTSLSIAAVASNICTGNDII